MVIAWIRDTIRRQADRTRSDFNTIQSSVERRLKDADQSVENHYQTLTHAAHSRLQRLQSQIETDHDKVISQSRNHLAIAQERMTTQHQQVKDHTRRVFEMAEKDLAHTWLILGERTHTQINGAEQALMTTHGGLIASDHNS